MTTILVTGATGTVGSKLVKRLAGGQGIAVRAGVRALSKTEDLKQAGADIVELDLEAPETFAKALVGVDKLFLLAPPMRDQVGASARLIEHAVAARVGHIVKLSALGCDDEPTIAFGRAHRDVEKLLATTGIPWTALRPNNFMDNFLGARHGTFAPNARGNIELPFGSAACSFVAADDIAAVATVTLTTGGHAGKIYDLTGPEALGLAEAAAILSQVTGRAIRYVDVAEEIARSTLSESRMPPPMVDAVMELYALGKAGRAALVTRTVHELTGKPARTFATFAKENLT